MRVLITGGYGCIGAWIIRNLIDAGSSVWVYDLREDLSRLKLILTDREIGLVSFIKGDIVDQALLVRQIQQNDITHIIHLAGLQVPACSKDPIMGAQTNVLGTLAVFEAIGQTNNQIQGFVYASSAAVFGPPDKYPSGPLADSVRLHPSTHYGYFKCCNEGNAAIYFQDRGISSIGLRPWTVYGVGRDKGMTSEPTKAIKALALGRPYHITYGGWQDLQLVNDVAKVFIRCVATPYRGCTSYNLRGHVVNIETFHAALCQVDPAAQKFVTFGSRQLAIAYDLDDAALQRDFGPLPITPLVDGIRQTMDQFRSLQRSGNLDCSDLDLPEAKPNVPVGDSP